jgi:hypothetical protein
MCAKHVLVRAFLDAQKMPKIYLWHNKFIWGMVQMENGKMRMFRKTSALRARRLCSVPVLGE